MFSYFSYGEIFLANLRGAMAQFDPNTPLSNIALCGILYYYYISFGYYGYSGRPISGASEFQSRGPIPRRQLITLYKHFTRYRENLHISYCRTSCRVSTVNIQGPKLWNYILNNHHELATLKSLNVFKSKFKKLLIFEVLCFNWLGTSLFLFFPPFFF